MSASLLPILIVILLPIMQQGKPETPKEPEQVIYFDYNITLDDLEDLDDLMDVEEAIKSGYILRDE